MSRKKSIEELTINTIRGLAIDGPREADSGHPGAAMALAPVSYVLYKEIMDHNPENPNWVDRDRFILSAGHASMLLYSTLFLSGYDISLEDLKNFRQLNSKTPGHPELDVDLGVETTTGPLGQGLMNGVGMAMAEAHLAKQYNKDDLNIFDHYTYVICSDGDLMEGASHEAGSLAGHLGLGKLIAIYDDNHISIEGDTALAFTEDVAQRFESYGWQVINVGENANDIEKIEKALHEAKQEPNKPSIIIVRTHIGYGSPNMQDTPDVHGSPLDEDEIKLTKENYGLPADEKFYVPDEAQEHMSNVIEEGKEKEAEWQEKWEEYQEKYPEDYQEIKTRFEQNVPDDLSLIDFDESDGPIATRKAAGNVLREIAQQIPWIIGGSADLSPSTKTLIDDEEYFQKGTYENRNIDWGVREHVMCSASSGLALHGGVRPFAATFFVFSDYARPAIRLASFMKLPVIYYMTHDSIGIGEDGPTHQPVEQLASFRAMPNLDVIRPGDANEARYAWQAVLEREDGPSMFVLTRQSLPVLNRDQDNIESAEDVLKGGYVLSYEDGEEPDIILIATGSEIHLALDGKEELAQQDIDARVVSLSCWERFQRQSEEYQEEVLPSSVSSKLAIEAGTALGWEQFIGENGDTITVDKFGTSAPYKDAFADYGFTVRNIVKKTKDIIS